VSSRLLGLTSSSLPLLSNHQPYNMPTMVVIRAASLAAWLSISVSNLRRPQVWKVVYANFLVEFLV